MSNVIPRLKSEYLQWCTNHATPFTDNATSIGLTSAQVEAWSAAFTTAKDKFNAAQAARDNARSATISSDDAIASSRGLSAELVRLIKNHAIATNNPNVYALANIPAPTPPSQLPPPGAPINLRAALNAEDGSLTLRWKTNNAKGLTGVVYKVTRRVGFTGPFEFIGAVGGSVFLDDTLPRGPESVQYIVQGLRGATEGTPSPVFTVFFGVEGGGGAVFIASTAEGDGEDVKMAA